MSLSSNKGHLDMSRIMMTLVCVSDLDPGCEGLHQIRICDSFQLKLYNPWLSQIENLLQNNNNRNLNANMSEKLS